VLRTELEDVLLSLGGVFDGEEPVDELSHALQTAGHALRAGADDELLAAALLHDVARSPLVAQEYPEMAHEAAAAAWLAPRFSERVAWLAGAHVAAKLYLLGSDPAYRQLLSPESVKSAGDQQQHATPFPTDDPRWSDAVLLRRWDDAAKRVDASPPAVDLLLARVNRVRRD
jgi:predicted HD phosphohydrolase